MPRSLKIRQPNTAEIRQLHDLLEDKLNAQQRRRAEVILLYATGMQTAEIASVLEVHRNTVYADLHAFDQQGLTVLQAARVTQLPPCPYTNLIN